MAHARILIVEDEILVAREMQSYLEAMEYHVVDVAIDSEMALEQIAQSLPDLVLMDINLQGGQDGIALAASIRDRFQIPVVYITAYADDVTLNRAKETNPFGYVLKPFSERDLRVAVELALFRQSATPERSPDQPESLLSDSPIGGLPPRKLQAILHYIEANLNQTLSLETLAAEVSVTTYYFARLFKQSTGKAVHQYVIQQRVARAKQLLKESNRSIAAIATDCGFANPSHLALHFKRLVGISPKRFRHLEGTFKD